MPLELIFFYVLGGGALLSAAMLVFFFKNPVFGALSFITTLICLAGLFVLLDAHFLAAVQVMVYAGAIMVLFLFVTMLLNLREEELGAPSYGLSKWLGAAAVVFITVQLCVLMFRVDGPVKGFDVTALPESQLATFGTIEGVGRSLFRDFLVPFELTSVLILAAIVAAVVVAKKRV